MSDYLLDCQNMESIRWNKSLQIYQILAEHSPESMRYLSNLIANLFIWNMWAVHCVYLLPYSCSNILTC